jgi:hypothetical protein
MSGREAMDVTAKWSERNLVFLLSQPRAGSTLLQRILAAHEGVATVPESWLLIPLFYAARREGVFAEYGHIPAANALAAFAGHLPAGMNSYYEGVRDLAVSLFSQAAKTGPRYFIEKTPRNALIAAELFRCFRGSRFVFLWRNPLAVAASLIETFGKGRWNLYRYRSDLYTGLAQLVDAYRDNAATACALRYEDLVSRPVESCRAVFSYLGLEYDDSVVYRFAEVRLDGRMGDPGRERHSDLVSEPLHKWTATLANPVRKAWARRYLRWLGADRLRLMGYEPADIEAELAAAPTRMTKALSDLARQGYGVLNAVAEIDMTRRKWSRNGWRGLLTRHS